MRSIRTYISPFVLGLSLVGAAPAVAQPDELTHEFSKLSAKERARIAQEEEAGAANDPEFQLLMTTGEKLFRTGDFDAALTQYQAARNLRPYNVYPKVKIQDLQVLIAERTAQLNESVQPDPGPSIPPLPSHTDEVRAVAPLPVSSEPLPTKVYPLSERTPPTPSPAGEPYRSTAPVATPTKAPIQNVEQELTEGERVYKEGRSIVVETTVVEDGHLVRYRKVSHPWGEDHYFRAGTAISDRTYRTALGR